MLRPIFMYDLAQLTYRESLRDIECCLRSVHEKLYHMGIRGKVSKSTLADANILDQLIPEAGAIYLMDRGYLDFIRLYKLHHNAAFLLQGQNQIQL